MSRKYYFISVIILSIFILSCISFSTISVDKNTFNINKNIYNNVYNKKYINHNGSIARLVINKINIDNYIYNFDSKLNTVSKNVSLLKQSKLPSDKENNSIIFLAAHSGTGKIAYFKNLDKLKVNDLVYFYYNDYKYIYKVTDIFQEIKDGSIEINQINKNQLTLTTCSPNNKDKQLIVNNILIQKEEI